MPATIRQGPALADYDLPIQLGPRGPFPDIALSTPLDRRWQHYVFLSRDGELAMVANVAWAGPEPDLPQPSTRNTSILAVYRRGEGWRASQYNCQTYVPLWSAFRLPNVCAVPQPFHLASVNGALSVRLEVQRTCRPCIYQTEVFGGIAPTDVQHFRWQAEPGVIARGDWEVAGRVYQDVAALGYQDRTCGSWSWPELGGWVWGFVNDPAQGERGSTSEHGSRSEPQSPPPISLTISLIQPDHPAGATNGSIMLWRDGRVRRHFPRRHISFAARGQLDRNHIVQVPEMEKLFNVRPMPTIPRRLVAVGHMGADWVCVDFQCEEAMRVVVPNETGILPFSVHEVIGTYQIDGQCSGRRFAFQTHGIIEFAGGAGGE